MECVSNPFDTRLQLLVGARLIRLGNLISVQLKLLVGTPAGGSGGEVLLVNAIGTKDLHGFNVPLLHQLRRWGDWVLVSHDLI
jgi:hypothetical protein